MAHRFTVALLALGALLVPRLASAACSAACTVHLVDAACADAERPLTSDTDVELTASCTATCTGDGRVVTGIADPTTVPIRDLEGRSVGDVTDTGRSCGAAKVYHWRTPSLGGLYFLGSRRFDVRGPAFLATGVLPSPPEPLPSPPRDWEDVRFGLELGVGPSASLVGRHGEGPVAGVGAELVFGLHDVRRPIEAEHGEKFSWPEIQGLRWCASVGCGFPLLLIFAPADALLGNDRGVDIHVEVLSFPANDVTRSSPSLRIGVQPRLRYARGIARTGTLTGMLLPEIAWTTGGGAPDALAFAWSAYPVDFLVDRRHLVVALEPLRGGLRIPFDGAPVVGELRTTISFRWIR
jgi:hypothetical protein